jgi:integrase
VRSIVLGQFGLGLIERYRDIMREMLRREPEGWLLSYDAGATPLRAKALGQATAGFGKGLGLDVTTHSFRRVSATQLVAAGIDVDTAARRMGHTKEVMLPSYVLGCR